MKIEIEKYELKYFFKFFFGLMSLKTLKEAGIFKKEFIKNFVKSLFKKHKDKQLRFAIIADKKIVGGLDLTKVSNGTFNIGCIVFKKYRSKGIATKAIKKLFVLAKSKGAKKIIGINDKDNFASIKLIKKLGYKKVKEDKGEIYWEKKLK